MHHKLTQLPNKLSIMTVPMSESQTVTVMILVRTGSSYETKELSGISHFLEHMCFKGTTSRTNKEIMRYLDGLGAESNAFTSHELTGYYAKGRYVHWKKFLAVMSDIYRYASFPPEEIEKERGVIMGEIDMYADNPMQQIYPDWMSVLYGDQPAGRSILGSKENIKKFTREDFVNYHNQHYVAEKTTIVIAGRVRHREVVEEVKKYWQDLSSGKTKKKDPVQELQEVPELYVRYKETDQVHLMVGVRAYDRFHKDRAVVALIAGILGQGSSSRLAERLREDMGAGYYVSAASSTFTDHGYLALRTGTSLDRVEEVLGVLIAEMKRLISEPVSAEELAKVKEYLIGNITMGLESSDEWADFFSQQYVLGGPVQSFAQYSSELRAVTGADIQRVAKKIFVSAGLNGVIIGPLTKTKALARLLTFS